MSEIESFYDPNGNIQDKCIVSCTASPVLHIIFGKAGEYHKYKIQKITSICIRYIFKIYVTQYSVLGFYFHHVSVRCSVSFIILIFGVRTLTGSTLREQGVFWSIGIFLKSLIYFISILIMILFVFILMFKE